MLEQLKHPAVQVSEGEFKLSQEIEILRRELADVRDRQTSMELVQNMLNSELNYMKNQIEPQKTQVILFVIFCHFFICDLLFFRI